MKFTYENIFDERNAEKLKHFIDECRQDKAFAVLEKPPLNEDEAREYAHIIAIIINDWLYMLQDAVKIADSSEDVNLSFTTSLIDQVFDDMVNVQWSLDEI